MLLMSCIKVLLCCCCPSLRLFEMDPVGRGMSRGLEFSELELQRQRLGKKFLSYMHLQIDAHIIEG